MPRFRIARMTGLSILLMVLSSGPAAAQSASGTAATALGATRSESAPERVSLDFWQSLGDSTLASLTSEALRSNRDLELAEARVRQVRAARLNAALDLAPTVTAAAGFSRQRTSGASFGFALPDRNLWNTELRGAWEIDVFGRLRRTLRAQGALTASAVEDVRDVRRLLTAELASEYYELRGVEEQLEVAQLNAENQERTLQLTRDRLDAGRGTAFDTERAQAQLSSTLAMIPMLEARRSGIEHRIAVLVGRDPQSGGLDLSAEKCRQELPERLEIGNLDTLIRSRPDVRAAERLVAAETAFVGAAKADYLPRVSVGATAGFTSTTLDSLTRSGTGWFAVGPVITWPLLNLGRVKAQVDAAQALQAEAQARFEQTVLLAREEVESALAMYRGARTRLARLEEAADASARAAELARIRFDGGVADFLEVLDAERSLLASQDQLAQGRTDAVTALVAVYRALGADGSTTGP